MRFNTDLFKTFTYVKFHRNLMVPLTKSYRKISLLSFRWVAHSFPFSFTPILVMVAFITKKKKAQAHVADQQHRCCSLCDQSKQHNKLIGFE